MIDKLTKEEREKAVGKALLQYRVGIKTIVQLMIHLAYVI